jgi:hypothetical protein
MHAAARSLGCSRRNRPRRQAGTAPFRHGPDIRESYIAPVGDEGTTTCRTANGSGQRRPLPSWPRSQRRGAPEREGLRPPFRWTRALTEWSVLEQGEGLVDGELGERVAASPGDRGGLTESVERRLLGSFGDRVEDGVEGRTLAPELAFDHDVDVDGALAGLPGDAVCGGEGEEDLAGAVVADAAGAAEADVDPAREPAQLSWAM